MQRWSFPILTAIRGAFGRNDDAMTASDAEVTPPRPPPSGGGKNIEDLEALGGGSPTHHGTYTGGQTGNLHDIMYWPTWDSYAIHNAEGRAEGYVSFGRWFGSVDDAKDAIERFL
jgi:hypothetical protein